MIIPTLNEEQRLPATLANVAACAPGCELVIADGGSMDRTRDAVERASGPALVWLDAPRGRGAQMNAGAARARGDVLLFLHADTHLPPGADAMVERALADPRVVGGNFRVRFVPRAPMANLFTWCYNARTHARIFYGDSAIFLRREAFEKLGGYRAARVMEDIELVRRMRRLGRLAYIREGEACTSTRRFPRSSAAVRMLGVWTLLHVLMACGASQETLERFYPEVR